MLTPLMSTLLSLRQLHVLPKISKFAHHLGLISKLSFNRLDPNLSVGWVVSVV